MEINNITFGANFIRPAKVKKRMNILGYDLYFPSKASFVQIDFKNETDVSALEQLKNIWKGAAFLLLLISLRTQARQKVFALTTQKKDFNKLEPDKILGLVKMNDYYNKNGELEYLQVNPADITVDNWKNTPYKKCGTAILDSLKTLYNRIHLISVDEEEIEDFYKHNGFKPVPHGYCRYLWENLSACK